jgi:hypothetical protein
MRLFLHSIAGGNENLRGEGVQVWGNFLKIGGFIGDEIEK